MAIHARKPVDWLKEDPNQPRKHFDPDELRRLGEDMLAHGQYRPVGARPDGTVIYGGRQLRAARLVGMTELEVKIFDGPLSATDVGVMQWCENELRSALSDPEKSDFCAGLLRLNPDWTQKELAARLQVSEATVTHLLAVFKCVPAVQDAYRGGLLSRKDVYGMSMAGSEREQHELLAARLSGQLKNGQDVHRRARQARNGAGQPAERVSRIKCPLPSGAVVQVSGEGISLDDAIEAAQEWVKKARKASELGWDCKTFERACRDEAKA